MRCARTINEVVQQLAEAQEDFLNADVEDAKVAWEEFRDCCQQLSQWIEHCVPKEIKPKLIRILFAAEKVLLDHQPPL